MTPLHGRCVAGIGAVAEFCDEFGQLEVRADGDLLVDQFGQGASTLPSVPARTPAGRFGGGEAEVVSRRVRTSSRSGPSGFL